MDEVNIYKLVGIMKTETNREGGETRMPYQVTKREYPYTKMIMCSVKSDDRLFSFQLVAM